jgi:hypothetical protein
MSFLGKYHHVDCMAAINAGMTFPEIKFWSAIHKMIIFKHLLSLLQIIPAI